MQNIYISPGHIRCRESCAKWALEVSSL